MDNNLDLIKRIEIFPVMVPFKKDFSLGNGTVGTQSSGGPVVFVKVETQSGLVGWGEQRALPFWSYETVETMVEVIKGHLAPLIIGESIGYLNVFHEQADKVLSPSVSNGFPFAKAAVDIALHDLTGKFYGVPLHILLGGKIKDTIPLALTVGHKEIEESLEKIGNLESKSVIKLKVSGNLVKDIENIERIIKIKPDCRIWLDANQSYEWMNALQIIRRVENLENVICFEQPLRSTDFFGMRRLNKLSNIPIAFDEGCFNVNDLIHQINSNMASAIVLKISKSGGIRESLQMGRLASACGIPILASGLTDCGVGLAASAHLFSTLKIALPADLNGPDMLEDLLVEGLEFKSNEILIPDNPGLGVEVKEYLLRDLIIKDYGNSILVE